MKSVRYLLAVWCTLALSVLTVTAQDKNAWHEKLDTTIAEGIRMLEAKEYMAFLKAFVEPDQFKKFSEAGPIEDFAKNFAERKASQVLEVLKQIKGKKPNMEKDGTEANFNIDVEGISKKDVKFKKIDKYWYIMN